MKNNKSFPKVSAFSKLKPNKAIGNYEKKIALALKQEDLIFNEELNEIVINLNSCYIESKGFDKAKFIKLLRWGIDLSQPNVKIGFWALNELCLNLNLRFGSKETLILFQTILNLTQKHVEAYLDYKNLIDFKYTIVPSTTSKGYNKSLYLTDSNFSRLGKPWVYKKEKNTYYILDKFLKAMLDYGYTKDQIRGVIHQCEMTERTNLIPEYIRRKYLMIPNAQKSYEDIINNGRD